MPVLGKTGRGSPVILHSACRIGSSVVVRARVSLGSLAKWALLVASSNDRKDWVGRPFDAHVCDADGIDDLPSHLC